LTDNDGQIFLAGVVLVLYPQVIPLLSTTVEQVTSPLLPLLLRIQISGAIQDLTSCRAGALSLDTRVKVAQKTKFRRLVTNGSHPTRSKKSPCYDIVELLLNRSLPIILLLPAKLLPPRTSRVKR
jgi:hypothetical protein